MFGLKLNKYEWVLPTWCCGSEHWGTEAWIQTHLLGYIAMLGHSLERMYSPSIAMYPSKCVCIHASVTVRALLCTLANVPVSTLLSPSGSETPFQVCVCVGGGGGVEII